MVSAYAPTEDESPFSEDYLKGHRGSKMRNTDADFLSSDNLCGQTLLKLVSRGNAIIAEILRLSDFIPSVFTSSREQEAYSELLMDFKYFTLVGAIIGLLRSSMSSGFAKKFSRICSVLGMNILTWYSFPERLSLKLY